jgi:hypothetical protein
MGKSLTFAVESEMEFAKLDLLTAVIAELRVPAGMCHIGKIALSNRRILARMIPARNCTTSGAPWAWVEVIPWMNW